MEKRYLHYADAMREGVHPDAYEEAAGCGVAIDDTPEGWDTRLAEIEAYSESEEV